MFQKLAVKGEGTFKLPEGKLAQVFGFERNISVLEPNDKGPWQKDGQKYGVVDSVHLPAYRTEAEQGKAIRELLVRNGAQPIAAAA
ncbi:MAG: hypothetical protein AAF988_05555 [Pseudomonadota bacterium]